MNQLAKKKQFFHFGRSSYQGMMQSIKYINMLRVEHITLQDISFPDEEKVVRTLIIISPFQP